jgi:flagellar motility protein MotE (MotC chaperone)
MKRPGFIRLLPGVLVVGVTLLGLKTSGLVHGAYAQEGAKPAAPGQSAALAAPPSAANPDFAGGDDQIASAAEVDVLTSLSKRRAELDAREQQMNMQANILAAAEQRVDAKIAQLKQLQDQIGKLLAQRDAAQDKQVASLVKTYSAMKAKDAARIFNSLSDDVLVPVAEQMKSDVLAPVLASMNSDAAQKLTVKLANRLAVPEMAPPPVPPGPQAALAPPAPGTAPVPGAAPAPAAPAAPAPQAAAAPAAAPAAKPKPAG